MSALAKTSTANAPATPPRTSPFSIASPSTCSNRTKPANAESTENASRPVGTMTTYFNSSEIKMRLPCPGSREAGPRLQPDCPGLGSPVAFVASFAAHKKVDAARRACFLVEMYSTVLEMEIVQATPADVGAVAPLFDAYRQFYKRPSNEEAARRFLFARLSKGESVLFYAQHLQTPEGFVHLYPVFSSLNLTRQWILSDLFVVPEAR